MGPPPPWPARDLLATLLANTLAYAVEHVPYYSNLAGRVTLEEFPIVDRDVVAVHWQEMLAADRFPDYVVSSSGTTAGAPNITFRNADEYEAAHAFLTGVRTGEMPALGEIREFAIDLFFNTNGYSWRKPRGWPVISLVLEQAAHAAVVQDLVRNGLTLAGQSIPATHLLSQNGPLRTLTGWFAVNGFSPAEHQLRTVHGYGSHLSTTWRTRLAEFWGAEILTSYGLMEFGVGGATTCAACGWLHYRTAWPEFLRLEDDAAVESGDARLVLTSLVPFVYVQPRIRYDTGDVVSVGDWCDHAQARGFRFRGRATSTAVGDVDGRREVLLSEIDVIEALDQLDGIGCRPHTSERQLWSDPDIPRPSFRMGFPRFSLIPPAPGRRRRTVGLTVETTFDPAVERQRARRLRELVHETLHRDQPSLERRIRAADTVIRVALVPPGGR